MATLRESLGVGIAIGIGWFLGTLLLGGGSIESALTGDGVTVVGAAVAFAVGTVVSFLFR
jgi:ABC-type uncharacterized transport system YnjBCD permease subunit